MVESRDTSTTPHRLCLYATYLCAVIETDMTLCFMLLALKCVAPIKEITGSLRVAYLLHVWANVVCQTGLTPTYPGCLA